MTNREKAIEKIQAEEIQLRYAEHDGARHTIVQVYADGDITIHKAASSSECSALVMEGKARVLKTYGGFGSCSCDICAETGGYDPDNDDTQWGDTADVLVDELSHIEHGFFDDEK